MLISCYTSLKNGFKRFIESFLSLCCWNYYLDSVLQTWVPLPIYYWNCYALEWVMDWGAYNGSFHVFFTLHHNYYPKKSVQSAVFSLECVFWDWPNPFVARQPAKEHWFGSLIVGKQWVIVSRGRKTEWFNLWWLSNKVTTPHRILILMFLVLPQPWNSFEATLKWSVMYRGGQKRSKNHRQAEKLRRALR